jgi:NAD-dependent deacetylase
MADSKTVLNKVIKKSQKQLNDSSGKIIAITGSGVSKGSGIPTFRGKDGLWRNYNAQDLATPQAFAQDPELVWEWYNWRIDLISEKEPNAAHLALVELEKANKLSWIITQNVDSLHQRAGSKNILEVHGNIFRTKCSSCGKKYDKNPSQEKLPRCSCGGLLRPDVVWFGESLDREVLLKCDTLLQKECAVLLIVGTSGLVYPVAAFPQIAKQASNALIIEFNVEKTPISSIADNSILGKAENTLPEFVKGLIQS